MTCFYPRKGYYSGDGRVLLHSERNPDVSIGNPLIISCGQCIGCRIRRSRDWAVRVMHEALNYDDPVFVTLTYSDPEKDGASIVSADLQKFWKRCRYHRGQFKRFGPVDDNDINKPFKYFAGSEYGTRFKRPHFHAVIFGCHFSDRYPWKTMESGFQIWRSPSLEALWPHGFSSIGSVTFESAQYVASYIVTKETGKACEEYDSKYVRVDRYTGEIRLVEPEKGFMSLNPCIASNFAGDFEAELRRGFILLRGGTKVPLPKMYNEILKDEFGEDYARLEEERMRFSDVSREDRTPARLRAREICAIARSNLKRGSL